MSDNLKVEESFVESLLEQAAWTAANIEISERKTAKKEANRPGTPGGSTADLDLGDDDPEMEDEEDEDSVGRMGNHDEAKKKKVKEKKVKEATEEHTCPLCESTLDEELSDEKVLEHVAQIQAALTTLEEGGDDDDVEPTDDDLDAIENEGPDEKKKSKKKESKKESVMKKVKELKKSAAGK